MDLSEQRGLRLYFLSLVEPLREIKGHSTDSLVLVSLRNSSSELFSREGSICHYQMLIIKK